MCGGTVNTGYDCLHEISILQYFHTLELEIPPFADYLGYMAWVLSSHNEGNFESYLKKCHSTHFQINFVQCVLTAVSKA